MIHSKEIFRSKVASLVDFSLYGIKHLTKDKWYDVEGIETWNGVRYFRVYDDGGNYTALKCKLFKTLKTVRNEKITDILGD